MRVYLGGDHAGFELKSQIARHLTAAGHEVVCAARSTEAITALGLLVYLVAVLIRPERF